jgi:phage tail protein X
MMPILTVRKEKELDQLIAGAYGKLSAAQLKAVRAATLAANPQLGEDGVLKPGMVIVVPPPKASARARANAVAAVGVVKSVRAALTGYQVQLAQAIDADMADLDQTAKTLKSAAFRKASETVPPATEWAKEVEAAVKADQAEAVDRRTLLKQIDALVSRLDVLAEKLA